MSWSEITNAPGYVVLILVFNVWLCEWLCKHTRLRVVSSSLLVIILTAIMANLTILPSASNPSVVYDFIFQYIAPLSIFFLLLGVKLIDVKKAGVPMTIGFLLGAAGTFAGSLVSMWVFNGEELFGEKFYAVGGMMTGHTREGASISMPLPCITMWSVMEPYTLEWLWRIIYSPPCGWSSPFQLLPF